MANRIRYCWTLLRSVGWLILGLGIGGLPLAAGLYAVGWQAVNYLQAGEWFPFSVVDALIRFGGEGEYAAWARDPKSWVGLWRILNQVSGGLVMSLVGAGIVSLGLTGFGDVWDEHHRNEAAQG